MSQAREASSHRETVGGLLVGAASVLFGVVVVLGKLVLRAGMTVTSMLAIRFGVGALVLAALVIATRRPLTAAMGERRALAILAVCGYAVESSFFFAAAQHGTAAAVTLLFFTYPVFVTVVAWALGKGAPARLTLLALASAVGGAALVVATGGGLAIEPIGAAFAMASALTYTAYLVGADLALRRTNAFTSAMWVSAGASLGLAVFTILTGRWVTPPSVDVWVQVVAMGLASAAAFVCLLEGLQRIGAVRTSIVAATEPLAAAVLGYIVLDEPLGLGTAIGGALILAGAVAASIARGVTVQEQQIP